MGPGLWPAPAGECGHDVHRGERCGDDPGGEEGADLADLLRHRFFLHPGNRSGSGHQSCDDVILCARHCISAAIR